MKNFHHLRIQLSKLPLCLLFFKIFNLYLPLKSIFENTFRIGEEKQPIRSELHGHCIDYKRLNCSSQAICIERCLIKHYFLNYSKLPIDITYDPNDEYWDRTLNLTKSKLYFDTNINTTKQIKEIKDSCVAAHPELDCEKYSFTSVNSREKGKKILKLSLYFDQVKINHKNKMELINLLNYLIGILSLWFGFSYKIIEKYANKLLTKFLNLKKSQTLINFIALIGIILHTYYIILLVQNNQITVTFFQPSKFILSPLFSLCFELKNVVSKDYNKEFNEEYNEEYNGLYLKKHTKNLSQLVGSIRFLNKKFIYKELNLTDLEHLEAKQFGDHFFFENLEYEIFFYFKYKML